MTPAILLMIVVVLSAAALMFFARSGAKPELAVLKTKRPASVFLAVAVMLAPTSPAFAQAYDCYSKGNLGALGRGLLENTQWGIHGVPAGAYGNAPVSVTTAYVAGTSTLLNGLPSKGTRRFAVTWNESARQIIGAGFGADNVLFTVNLTSATSTAELRSGGWLRLTRRTAFNHASSPFTETYDATFHPAAGASTHSPCPQSGGGSGGSGSNSGLAIGIGAAALVGIALWALSGDDEPDAFAFHPVGAYEVREDGGESLRYGTRLEYRGDDWGMRWGTMTSDDETLLSYGGEWRGDVFAFDADAEVVGEAADFRAKLSAEWGLSGWTVRPSARLRSGLSESGEWTADAGGGVSAEWSSLGWRVRPSVWAADLRKADDATFRLRMERAFGPSR